MLSKEKRLDKKEVALVFLSGKTEFFKDFLVKFLEARGKTSKEPEVLPLFKFSFIVSSKEEPRANKRNLIRRRGYSALRDVLASQRSVLKGVQGPTFSPGVLPLHCIFLCKKSIANLNFEELKKEIKFALQKINII